MKTESRFDWNHLVNYIFISLSVVAPQVVISIICGSDSYFYAGVMKLSIYFQRVRWQYTTDLSNDLTMNRPQAPKKDDRFIIHIIRCQFVGFEPEA